MGSHLLTRGRWFPLSKVLTLTNLGARLLSVSSFAMTVTFHGGHVETPERPPDLKSYNATLLVRVQISIPLGLP